jgi:hypothetical protein
MLKWVVRFLEQVLEQRRWLPRVILVLVIAIVLIGTPLYSTGKPSFFKRYPKLIPYYETWAKSTHAQVMCWQCHLVPGQLNNSLFRIRMIAEFYVSIVSNRTPNVLIKPPNEACTRCHYLERKASPSGDLKIPHLAHVKVLKLRCIYCHKWAVHFKNPEGKNTPRMVTCLKCHNGKKATNKCTACHKEKIYPVSHRAKNWLQIHSQKQKEINCKRCHGWVKKFCSTCHKSKPASHKGYWRTTHRLRVAQRRNCEACHQPSFCVRCHGEVPQLNISQAPKFVTQ